MSHPRHLIGPNPDGPGKRERVPRQSLSQVASGLNPVRTIRQKAVNVGLDAFKAVIVGLSALPRSIKQAIVFSHDLGACVVTMYLAYCLRFGAMVPLAEPVRISTVAAIVCWTVAALLSGVYSNIFRFTGRGAILILARATGLAAVGLVLILGTGWIDNVPRTVSIIAPAILLIYLFVSRVTIRYVMIDVLEQFDFVGSVRRLAIYGSGAAAQQVAGSIGHERGIHLVSFIDHAGKRAGSKINGKPVWSRDDLEKKVRDFDISDIVIALPDLSRTKRNKIVEQLKELKVRVMLLPPVMHVLDGRISISDLREIQIEDVLGRAQVPPDEALVGAAIHDRTVLVTGAGGSIGSELCRQIMAFGPRRLILAEMAEFSLYAIERELRETMAAGSIRTVEIVPRLVDVTDRRGVDALFAECRPQTVFHAAAYKHVPLIEANPLAGLQNNLFGTLNCALAAEEGRVERFVLISTDKAVRPTNVMGASKRGCELILQGLSARGSNTRFAMVRFGNVLGSSGSVVPLFREQIARGGPITITHRDITRFFMTIPEAALLVMQAGAMAVGGEVYVLDMGEPVRIHDLAETMIKVSGSTVRSPANPEGDIEIVEIGLRPGEKLFEELLIGNDPQPTGHPRIMQAREASLDWNDVEELMARFDRAIEINDVAQAVYLIGRMVPEYQPSGPEVCMIA